MLGKNSCLHVSNVCNYSVAYPYPYQNVTDPQHCLET
jgi:hypothetical protein